MSGEALINQSLRTNLHVPEVLDIRFPRRPKPCWPLGSSIHIVDVDMLTAIVVVAYQEARIPALKFPFQTSPHSFAQSSWVFSWHASSFHLAAVDVCGFHHTECQRIKRSLCDSSQTCFSSLLAPQSRPYLRSQAPPCTNLRYPPALLARLRLPLCS